MTTTTLPHHRLRTLLRHMFRHGWALVAGVAATLLVGMAIYHFTEGLPLDDAFLNAAMLLGGMGPVAPIRTVAGKWLIGAYALWAGLLVIVSVGVMLGPVIAHAFGVTPEGAKRR